VFLIGTCLISYGLEKSGVKAGDIIISANGQSLVGKDVDEARTYILGELGTTLKMEVKRSGEVITFNLVREVITAPTVTEEVYGNIGIIHLTSFGADSANEFSKALDDLKLKNVKGYIVDIRNNGGGYVSTAQYIAGNFIGGKNIVLIVKDRDGIREGCLSPDKEYSVIDKKVVFLVNGYSASASEILSAAVKDYKKAILVGNKTFGKGVMQSMFKLSDESVLKLTTNRFYSPLNENEIQKVGISPDIETGKDDALKNALELFGDSGESLDKSGYIKFNMNGFDWEVNYDSVIQSNYKERYYNILNGIPAVSSISIGGKSGWIDFKDKKVQDVTSTYYSNPQDFKTILKDDKFLSFMQQEHSKDLSNIPDGLIIGDKEYSLSYLSDPKNIQEIMNIIKQNPGKLYGRMSGIENSKVVNIFNKKPLDISNYNSITYINDNGEETKYTNEFFGN
jgi:carboxyl-terminal processing protease